MPLGRPILKNQIYDPASNRTVNGQLVRDPFPGNIIPKNRFDPASYKIMSLYPATNQPIPTGVYPQNDFATATAGSQNTDQGDGRVDYRLSDKDSLFGSLSWSNLNKYNAAVLPGRTGRHAVQRGDGRGPGPQRAVQLDPRVDTRPSFPKRAPAIAAW